MERPEDIAQRFIDRNYPTFRDAFRRILPMVPLPEAIQVHGATPIIDPSPPLRSKGELLLARARAHNGKAYQWAGSGNPSFDCSGLVWWAAKEVGINIPRTTYAQVEAGVEIDWNDLRIGDLVFTDFKEMDMAGRYHMPEHVSIWAGEDVNRRLVFEAGDPIGFYTFHNRGPARARRIT